MVLGRTRTINKYIIGEFLFSFLVSFLFYLLVFFLNQLLLMAKDILAKGIPLDSVMLLILYSLPSFVTLSAPFATLTAALMAYGRFSSDNEILAMRSAGFQRFHIFRPVLVLGIVLAFSSFAVNDVLLPAGIRAFQKLWLELSLTHPGLELAPYSVRSFQQSVLITGDINEEGISPMVVIKRDQSGNRSIILAVNASPEIQGRQRQLPGFRMTDVFSLIPDAQNEDSWSWSRAETMDYRLLNSQSVILDQQSGPANMRVADVWGVIKDKTLNLAERRRVHQSLLDQKRWDLALTYASLSDSAGLGLSSGRDTVSRLAAEYRDLDISRPTDNSLQVWKLEFFQKFAIPFACIPVVVLAFPLGLSARRSGRAAGFFIGLLLTTFYWSLLVLGRSLGLRAEISPFLVMILPNLLLLAVGVLLYAGRAHA